MTKRHKNGVFAGAGIHPADFQNPTVKAFCDLNINETTEGWMFSGIIVPDLGEKAPRPQKGVFHGGVGERGEQR